MSDFNPIALLDAVVALLSASTGIQESLTGEPDSFDYQVTAYSVLGPITIEDEASGGLLMFHVEVFAGFAYRVTGDTDAAERVVVAAVADLTRRFYADRTLGGVVENGALMFDLNARPNYQIIDDQEHKLYLIRVLGDQREVIQSA